MRESAPMRVGFVVHVMQVAGAEMLVRETIRRLGRRLEPVVLCLDAVGELGQALRGEGVPVVALERRPGLDAGLPWRLAREARRRRLELLHAHQYTPFFYSALAKTLLAGRIRLVLTEHGRHFPDAVSGKRRLANRLFLARMADAVNACCSFSARALVENDGFRASRVDVVPNGVDTARFQAVADPASSRPALGLDPGRRLVATIARFHPVKDHRTLLEAFAQLADRRADVDLLLVGDGPLRPALEQRTAELRLAGRVRFLGVRSDVSSILAAADLFVLSSLSEAASLTLLEAMASARPVVVTAVGGNPELVRHGVEGLLVPRGDPDALATAMESLLDDPAAAASMGRNGRRRVEQHFRIEGTIEAYGDLYARLLHRR